MKKTPQSLDALETFRNADPEAEPQKPSVDADVLARYQRRITASFKLKEINALTLRNEAIRRTQKAGMFGPKTSQADLLDQALEEFFARHEIQPPEDLM